MQPIDYQISKLVHVHRLRLAMYGSISHGQWECKISSCLFMPPTIFSCVGMLKH